MPGRFDRRDPAEAGGILAFQISRSSNVERKSLERRWLTPFWPPGPIWPSGPSLIRKKGQQAPAGLEARCKSPLDERAFKATLVALTGIEPVFQD